MNENNEWVRRAKIWDFIDRIIFQRREVQLFILENNKLTV